MEYYVVRCRFVELRCEGTRIVRRGKCMTNSSTLEAGPVAVFRNREITFGALA